MKTSQTPRDYSEQAPLPTVSHVRRTLVRRIVRAAVEAYDEAARARAEIREAIGDDEEMDGIEDIAGQRVADAGLTLTRAILCIASDGSPLANPRAEMQLHSPRGVHLGGRFYMVVRNPLVDDVWKLGDETDRDEPVMMLSVVDRSAVDDMEETVIHDLAEDAPPAPAPPVVQAEDDDDEDRDDGDGNRKWFHRPMAFARGSHTFSDPGDRCPVTLEFVVVSNADGSASVADLPELQQAGWREDEFGPLTVFTRVHW